MEKHTCPVCKKEFFKKVYKKCQAVYCSQACAYRGRTLGYTKREIVKPYNCRRKQPRRCAICQKEFIHRKTSQKFCSQSCYAIHKETAFAGKNNPAYRDGSSYNKRSWRGDDWETLRKEIYERDKFTCCDCGVKCISKRNANKGRDSLKIIQCHHIENYRENKNNDNSNLITLCLSCHLKRHYPKKKGMRVG